MLTLSKSVCGQNATSTGENIVPNPGFESYASAPIGWFYKGEHFGQVMKYWTSPTATSPDVFGPKVRVPETWQEKGFGKQKAHGGNSMAGITVYGCSNGKPHCREYLQIQLAEPLVIGQNYRIEYQVTHLTRSLQVNNLGAAFSKSKINTKTEDGLTLKTAINSEKVLIAYGIWQKVSDAYIPDAEYEYLVIGNFFDDKMTVAREPRGEVPLNFGYYYIDDVVVKKIPPILPIPVKEDDLTQITIEKGKIVQLKDIYFEIDNSELLPRSFVELKKLLFLLRQNSQMTIELCGHTDSDGENQHNIQLSAARAQSVANFLIINGIDKKRLRTKGLGEVEPIADNMTEEGKQMNRRVEFVVTNK
jgi:outer membrane protein OmpA-like peptidoglycan-associated protein